jgi:NAD(P)-dependent dehydrogenase (short-subunit alcohol dehydrogenase family)
MTRALAIDCAPHVRVNAVAPGLTRTEMTLAMPEQVRSTLVGAIPAGRMARPAEIAEVVALLGGSRCSYVTGQVVLVCGGRSL